MISFFLCLLLLIAGFFFYSKITEKVFGPDDRITPALSMTDGNDYVPMGTPRIFLIQLLNIAGLGPIFGALAGACWGPSVFLWITFGTLFYRASKSLSDADTSCTGFQILAHCCTGLLFYCHLCPY